MHIMSGHRSPICKNCRIRRPCWREADAYGASSRPRGWGDSPCDFLSYEISGSRPGARSLSPARTSTTARRRAQATRCLGSYSTPAQEQPRGRHRSCPRSDQRVRRSAGGCGTQLWGRSRDGHGRRIVICIHGRVRARPRRELRLFGRTRSACKRMGTPPPRWRNVHPEGCCDRPVLWGLRTHSGTTSGRAVATTGVGPWPRHC